MEKIKTFRNLRTWQEAQRLVEAIYEITKTFPLEERFGLCDQMHRAAVSIPSNIAEGKGRASTKEYIQFLMIARGSLHEILSQIETSRRLHYSTDDKLNELAHHYLGLNAGINAHISSLSKYK